MIIPWVFSHGKLSKSSTGATASGPPRQYAAHAAHEAREGGAHANLGCCPSWDHIYIYICLGLAWLGLVWFGLVWLVVSTSRWDWARTSPPAKAWGSSRPSRSNAAKTQLLKEKKKVKERKGRATTWSAEWNKRQRKKHEGTARRPEPADSKQAQRRLTNRKEEE